MTPDEIQKFIKDTVYSATQSTKQENSGLIGHLERIMKEEIKQGIEINVNGKINNLTTMVENHIEKDTEWKSNVTPSIEIMKKMQGFTSVSGTIFKAVVLIASVTGSIYAFIKFVIHDKM